ncbi:hypothetical protein [Streptomyces sp. NBC_00150]|uniref:hypothetical protein n=1 Tax=Streptomyces sp. NBC_00150 TaxID=2975668 RepID=UPI0032547A56
MNVTLQPPARQPAEQEPVQAQDRPHHPHPEHRQQRPTHEHTHRHEQPPATALQDRVFQEEYGDGTQYRSLKDLYEDEEFMGTEGTHTILDIDRVVATQSGTGDYGTLRPLALRVVHHFGTDRPSVEHYDKLVTAAHEATSYEEHQRSLLGECQMRWTGYYIVLYTGDSPTHLGIFGSSGDQGKRAGPHP